MATPRTVGVRRLDALMMLAREPAFLLDAQGRFTFVNPAWEALTGRDAEATLGRASAPPGAPPDAAGPAPSGEAGAFFPPAETLAGRPSGGPCLVVRPDGERLWRRVEFWPLHGPRGDLAGIFGMVREADAPPHAPDAASRRARDDLVAAREAARRSHGIDALVGRGARHERLLGQVALAAGAGTPALLVGEGGTGKRLAARVIHQRGPRPEAPFLPIDVPALTPEALDRLLFAPPEGDAPPRLAAPEGATVALLGAKALPRDIQGRILAAMAGSRVRLVATACGPLPALRDGGAWRDDFFFAFTTLPIELPPLRERLEELPLLAQHFLEVCNRRGPRRRSGFDAGAMDVLVRYDWPGNLAELLRVVEWSHARASADRIAFGDLPAAIRGDLASAYLPPPAPPAVTPLDHWLMQLERRLIEQALNRARQNKSRAAELLDISRPRLYRRIKELNIPDVGDGDEGGSSHGEAPATT